MLLVFAMKCCTKMPCPMPHNHYCCLLPLPVCLPYLLICTCLISLNPLLAHHRLCYVYVYGVFFYFCYMLHFFVTPFWLVCAHIYTFIFIFVSFHAIATILYCHLPYGFSTLFVSDLILFLKFLMVLA